MIRFDSDYTEGCIPEILTALTNTNDEQTIGYGKDIHCQNAANLIKQTIKREDADVHFMVGGTQTNIAVITSILKHHQGAICAESGHINAHETGALESVGHKCLTLPTSNGKITAEQVDTLIINHYNQVLYTFPFLLKVVPYTTNKNLQIYTTFVKSITSHSSSMAQD